MTCKSSALKHNSMQDYIEMADFELRACAS